VQRQLKAVAEVELWFAKIERDVIARGIFTSVADLKRKLKRSAIICRAGIPDLVGGCSDCCRWSRPAL